MRLGNWKFGITEWELGKWDLKKLGVGGQIREDVGPGDNIANVPDELHAVRVGHPRAGPQPQRHHRAQRLRQVGDRQRHLPRPRRKVRTVGL